MQSNVQSLIDLYLDGTIADDQVQELDGLLREHAEAVEQFTHSAEIDHLLSAKFARDGLNTQAEQLLAAVPGDVDRFEISRGSKAPSDDEQPRQSVRGYVFAAGRYLAQPKPFSIVLAATFMALLITAMAFIAAPIYRQMAGGNSSAEGKFVRAGQLTGVHQAVWAEGQIGVLTGSKLLKGHRIDLQQGLAEITLDSGTRLVIEGPAELELLSENSASLIKGKTVAYVPKPATGFRMTTLAADIIDVGTEFGVETTGADDVAIRVLTGSVEVRPKRSASASFRLNKEQQVSVRAGRVIRGNAPVSFVRSLPGEQSDELELIGLYPFDGDAKDRSGWHRDANAVSDVVFVDGYSGQAAQFAGNQGSYIDLPIDADPARLPVMTWGAWVRPAAVTKRHTIFSTDNGGFDRTLTIDERKHIAPAGAPRICAHGGPYAGVLRSSSKSQLVDKWTFVAAVYDHPNAMVILYSEASDGKLTRDVFRKALPQQSLNFVRVGMHAGELPEPFVGEIDNVFIFRGKLSAGELTQIYIGGAGAILKLQEHGSDAPQVEEVDSKDSQLPAERAP